MRRFIGIDLGRERVPDATTLLKFRRLLEDNKLGEALFANVGEVVQASGMKLGTGTIVDATIISAPSSTKNKQSKRDPEMHQTRKGKQWYHGMKLHIGVDSKTGLAHRTVVTPANMHDKHPLPDLLHGHEEQVWGDSAYASQGQLIHSKAPQRRRTRRTRGYARTAASLVRWSASSTASSPVLECASSMYSPRSSACGGSTRCVTAGWPRTPRGRSWRWGWQTSTWRGDHCMEKSAPSGRKASRWLAERPEMACKDPNSNKTGRQTFDISLNSRVPRGRCTVRRHRTTSSALP